MNPLRMFDKGVRRLSRAILGSTKKPVTQNLNEAPLADEISFEDTSNVFDLSFPQNITAATTEVSEAVIPKPAKPVGNSIEGNGLFNPNKTYRDPKIDMPPSLAFKAQAEGVDLSRQTPGNADFIERNWAHFFDDSAFLTSDEFASISTHGVVNSGSEAASLLKEGNRRKTAKMNSNDASFVIQERNGNSFTFDHARNNRSLDNAKFHEFMNYYRKGSETFNSSPSFQSPVPPNNSFTSETPPSSMPTSENSTIPDVNPFGPPDAFIDTLPISNDTFAGANPFVQTEIPISNPFGQIPPLQINDSSTPIFGFTPEVTNFDNVPSNNGFPVIDVLNPSQSTHVFPGPPVLDEPFADVHSNSDVITPSNLDQMVSTLLMSVPDSPVALPLKMPDLTTSIPLPDSPVSPPISQPIMSPEVSSNPVIQANKGSDVTSNMVDNYMNSTRGQQKIEQNKQQRAQQQEQQRQALITQQQKEQEAIAAKENLAKTRQEAYEKRKQTNPVFAALDNMNIIEKGDQDNVAYQAFRESFQTGGTGNKKEQDMLREELLGANRNNNPETVNQRIDFYRNQGAINDEQAEPLKAFFNTNFENMDEEGVKGWFNQYRNNLKGGKMTPRQARLSVNQQMDNKREGFFSAGSKDNFKNFAGRALVGGAFGAAIGTATDDNPEAGFVAGVVGATAGKNIAGMLRNNTDMFEGKMINSLLKDTAKGKTRAQQLEAVDDLDDEALDFMDKMYKDKLTNNFGTANMFESSALTSSRNMTLGGAALAGVAFTPKKRDHRRGFNANRGNRI